MKRILLATVCLALAGPVAHAQQNTALPVLEESLQKLRAELEDVQFRLRKTEEELAALRKELREARGGVSAEQWQALEARLAALDAARQRDKQAIIEQLAKELASLGQAGARAGKEHVVQKGETLSQIARLHGVSVAELRKANNLSSDSLQIDQKLVIPR